MNVPLASKIRITWLKPFALEEIPSTLILISNLQSKTFPGPDQEFYIV